jgi:RNA polymerase-binding protein DksA
MIKLTLIIAFLEIEGMFMEDLKERMNKALLKLKEEIINNLISENDSFKSLVEDIDPKDLVDIAADDIDRKMLETVSAQDIKRLRLIDAALSRIQNGKYGICMKCGKKIPEERLEAIPYALMCISCKSSDEKMNR